MCFGPLKRLCHWGPFIALFLIFYITTMSVYCDLVYWPPTLDSYGSIVHFIILSSWIFFILFNYFNAVFRGPGFVPLGWKPENLEDCKKLQFCEACQGYKSPRSHHCRHCKRCVIKMDHHCPWINTCCGHFNHSSFTYFLIFAPLGCMHGATVLILTVYHRVFKTLHYPKRRYPELHQGALVEYNILHLILTFLAIGFAIGVVIAVGFLFFIQIKVIIKNETGIESWIKAKALYRKREDEFVYPYHLGWKENMKQVFTWSGKPKSDGIVWPVVEGCTQYTLTIEQLKQKEEKRLRAIEYIVTEDYSGSWLPITKGCCTCIRVPLTDEPRIKINVDDIILVTRWKKYWMYGERIYQAKKENTEESKKKVRGWFPLRCAIQYNVADYPEGKSPVSKKDK
ncbi:palmitoyltransferase ZDHHC6-like [Anneissia japonica]|uniref:palmitoyltransferase ZDHHC6-like n=2 Tax=Anneissia japonica TaxID=1529436 RepID=UPI00142566BB|nr:palmitoyltransferase ZDHHC6-like [Anneissia japonica]XP_033111664.1 palmitoyltransferase ZDHHC6-like [Anneissia japonica]